MSAHKYIDKICWGAAVLALMICVAFMNAEKLGIHYAPSVKGYETRLFDTSTVHTLDIVMDDWESFIENAASEDYAQCSVVIDHDAFKNVAIRTKGNTSLTQVESYGNDRYSFKIEFDHYDDTKSYYGLDKLSLNNMIQDTTYMKDYLTYQMMGYFQADAPLCSYVYITVNGEDWGLYLAVEGVEEAFLERNYGIDYGELYKPDSTDIGGNRDNGTFDTDELPDELPSKLQESENQVIGQMPNQYDSAQSNQKDRMIGSNDVALIYTDDEYSSYPNIFDQAKTDITDSDKDRLISSLKQLNANENIEKVVNIDEVIRYFVVHNFVCNFDSYTGSIIHNYYLYEKDGQLSMIPWDYNLAFGGFQSSADATALVNYPIDTPVSNGTVDARPMLAWIFANEEYMQLYHQYFAEFIASYFDSGVFAEMFDSIQTLIAPYVEKDPTKFYTFDEFKSGVETLKEFCQLRAESITYQLDGTIASTAEGQTQNKESFVDASMIEISAMGTMNNGTQGMDGKENGLRGSHDTQFQKKEENQENKPLPMPQDDFFDKEMTEKPQNEVPFMPDDRQSMPEMPNGSQSAPEMTNGEFAQKEEIFKRNENSTELSESEKKETAQTTFILLAICAAALSAGILTAFFYKKRA